MSTTTDLTVLMSHLHQLQNQLNEQNTRLRRIPLILQAQEKNIAKLTSELNRILGEQQQLQLEAKGKEKEMLSSEQALDRRRTQLSEAKTNKEFLALKQQIEADEAANSVLADEALEAIEKSDTFHVNVEAAEAELKKAKDMHEASQKQFQFEEPVIKTDVEDLNNRLREAEKELPIDFKEVYDRLVRSLGGNEALAIIRNQKFCSGCNQLVAINTIAQVVQKKPVTCTSCGRLLYVPRDYQFDSGKK